MDISPATANDPYESMLRSSVELEHQGKYAAAISVLTNAATQPTTDNRLYGALGSVYVADKQFQMAVETFRKSEQLSPLSAADRFYLGTAFYNLGDFSAAQEQFAESIALFAGNPQPYLQMYSAYIKLNKPADALAILDEYLKRFSGDRNYETALGRANNLRAALKKMNPL